MTFCDLCKRRPAVHAIAARPGALSPQCEECYQDHLAALDLLRRYRAGEFTRPAAPAVATLPPEGQLALL
jgi:hypothetical protein